MLYWFQLLNHCRRKKKKFYTGKRFRGKFGYTLIKTEALKKTWRVQLFSYRPTSWYYVTNIFFPIIILQFVRSCKSLKQTPFHFLNFLTQICPSPSPRRILEHWYDCNTQINIGEEETHTCFTIFDECCSCVNLTRHWNGVSKNVLCIEKTQGNRSSREHSLSKDSWSLSDIPLVRTGLSSSELLLSSRLYSQKICANFIYTYTYIFFATRHITRFAVCSRCDLV